ncbi:MAG TPA: HEAT repeat domain-containing protein [Vicinamibacterales bacterium]
MPSLETLLAITALVALSVWAALSAHLLLIQRRRAAMQRLVTDAIALLEQDDVRRLSLAERIERVRIIAAKASRELIMRATADRETPDAAFRALMGYLTDRWGLETLLKDASAHKSSRDKWRRMTALRILFRSNHTAILDLLARAADQSDADVADVAFSLLGNSAEPRAMDILFDALRAHRHSASRIAMAIEQSPQLIADRLRSNLGDRDPVVRLWCATLLARYPAEPIENELASLTGDSDPRVRKAAIQTLGKVGDELAAERALYLLNDPFAYVRAHAARALGELARTDLADRVAPLLGDTDWWVRLAARESLEMMGPDVWPVLMRSLNHSDRFVRNGAAEVFQNLGVLDSLIVMEAATDNPGAMKIDMLRRIADAGGVRFTDSLVERAGPVVGPRIRSLLATIGLQHVGAA